MKTNALGKHGRSVKEKDRFVKGAHVEWEGRRQAEREPITFTLGERQPMREWDCNEAARDGSTCSLAARVR